MRKTLIEKMKKEIEDNLKAFLREEGIELYVAANDTPTDNGGPLVVLEAIEDKPLENHKLLSEIRVMLGILGKPWQCETLVTGLYQTLYPYRVTLSELTVLLMSLHVEATHCVRPRKVRKRAVIRYIVEEN